MSAKGQEVNLKATLEMASPDALNKMRAQKLSWYAVVSILLAAMGGKFHNRRSENACDAHPLLYYRNSLWI